MITRDRRRGTQPPDKRRWHNADPGEVHKVVIGYVEDVERQQFSLFNRFVQLEQLYDPNTPNMPDGELSEADAIGLVIENVIASNVDTVTAQIAAAEVRPRFQTDGGDWTEQKNATMLEWYAEGMGKLLDVHKACRRAFKECAKKGTGLVKVYVNGYDEVCVEHTRIDDIVVDEAECRNGGMPRQLHHRMVNCDREELKARFPEYAVEIDRAQRGSYWAGKNWAGYRPIIDDTLVAIESWKLPIGRRGKPGYVPGRHTIVCDGCDLLDEEWHDPFPFEAIVWSERTTSYYGISLAERIAGIQRALNKRNWQIDRNLDHYAIPVTYVDMADANLAIQSISRIGTVAVVKGARPTTVTPQANSPEVYQNRSDLKIAAGEDAGVSPMASTGSVPAGIDSGVGVREARLQSTSRFAPQEKDFETLVCGVHVRVIACCKQLGAAAPVISRRAKFGAKKIKWTDIDVTELKIQVAAASTLSRTPAGRYQIALEWAQAGVITTDEWRRLTKHPDLDHILSLYTQGMESVERDIEAMVYDEEVVVPEPFGNLKLMSRMGQMAYLKYRDLGAPEEILEMLRQYAVLAAHMFDSSMMAANQNAEVPPGAAPPAPGAEMGPPAGQPAPALSPQAMMLKAG
ncbi:MAG: hypothetical protein ACM358_11915 [Gemmatimonadota bacterium]